MTERKAKHLAFLIPSGAGGGVQRVMKILAEATAGLGRQVDLVVGRAEGPFAERPCENVRLVPLEKSTAFGGRWAALRTDPNGFNVLAEPVLLPLATSDMVSCLPALMRYLADDKPDLLMSAKVHTNLSALLARRAAKPKTRIVVSERARTKEPSFTPTPITESSLPRMRTIFLLTGIVQVSRTPIMREQTSFLGSERRGAPRQEIAVSSCG